MVVDDLMMTQQNPFTKVIIQLEEIPEFKFYVSKDKIQFSSFRDIPSNITSPLIIGISVIPKKNPPKYGKNLKWSELEKYRVNDNSSKSDKYQNWSRINSS